MKKLKWCAPVILAITLALTACRESRSPKPDNVEVLKELQQKATTAAIQAQQALKSERQIRSQVEVKLVQQEEAKSRWQGFTFLSIALAIVMLIVGAALGSKSRDDSQK